MYYEQSSEQQVQRGDVSALYEDSFSHNRPRVAAQKSETAAPVNGSTDTLKAPEQELSPADRWTKQIDSFDRMVEETLKDAIRGSERSRALQDELMLEAEREMDRRKEYSEREKLYNRHWAPPETKEPARKGWSKYLPW